MRLAIVIPLSKIWPPINIFNGVLSLSCPSSSNNAFISFSEFTIALLIHCSFIAFLTHSFTLSKLGISNPYSFMELLKSSNPLQIYISNSSLFNFDSFSNFSRSSFTIFSWRVWADFEVCVCIMKLNLLLLPLGSPPFCIILMHPPIIKLIIAVLKPSILLLVNTSSSLNFLLSLVLIISNSFSLIAWYKYSPKWWISLSK